MSAVIMESNASGISVWKTRWIYILVFLFPIAGVSVSHWYTTIFALLAFTALWDVFRSRDHAPLLKDEKIWLICCVGFFGSFLLSAVVNGWDEGQTRSIEVDIRYLFAVPLYLMLRRFPAAGRFFLAGVTLAAIALAAQVYYDMEVLHKLRAEGFYSPNLLGPVAALVAVWLLCGFRLWDRMKWVLPALVLVALYAVVMSGSRGAYLGLLVMCVLWVSIVSQSWWRWLVLGLLGGSVVGAYYGSDFVRDRTDQVVGEVVVYFQSENVKDIYIPGAGERFEMWKVAMRAFFESPLVGVGNKHFNNYAQKYVREGIANPVTARHGHAHNAYLQMLMSRGVVGATFFLGMLFYPLYFFAKTYHVSPGTALLGVTHVVGFAMFSLTDASTFIMGNFTSIFVLCMAIFMTWHVSRLQGAKR
jgi:O-antigen ligase